MRAEPCDIRLVECGERIHVGKEAQCLYDVTELCADGREMVLQIGHRLCGLGFDAAFDDAAIT